MNREMERLLQERKIIDRQIGGLQDACGHYKEHPLHCEWCGKVLEQVVGGGDWTQASSEAYFRDYGCH
jgi:hypothetical protein